MKSTIIKICALLLMIFFFIPVFSVCGMEQTLTINGADIIFGNEVNGQKFEGNGWMIFLLLLSAAVFAVSIPLMRHCRNRTFYGLPATLQYMECA